MGATREWRIIVMFGHKYEEEKGSLGDMLTKTLKCKIMAGSRFGEGENEQLKKHIYFGYFGGAQSVVIARARHLNRVLSLGRFQNIPLQGFSSASAWLRPID